MCERGTIFQYITVYEEVPYSVKDGIKLNAGKGLDNGKKRGCFYSWEYNYCQYLRLQNTVEPFLGDTLLMIQNVTLRSAWNVNAK